MMNDEYRMMKGGSEINPPDSSFTLARASSRLHPSSFDHSRLVIVEGVMGSGKSTLSKVIARRLRQQRYRSKLFSESFRDHPTSVTRTLTHWQKIWIEHTPETFIAQSLRNWEAFVANTRPTKKVYIFDGQFFHGDMTSLFIANPPRQQIIDYIDQLVEIIQPLRPVFIYLYQTDVAWGLERTAAVRGERFLRRQAAWKVDSPYCAERGYTGIPGLIQLYRDYRSLTDDLYTRLPIPKLAIENSAGNWAQDEQQALAFLGLDESANL
jgi:thymidylate kinase